MSSVQSSTPSCQAAVLDHIEAELWARTMHPQSARSGGKMFMVNGLIAAVRTQGGKGGKLRWIVLGVREQAGI